MPRWEYCLLWIASNCKLYAEYLRPSGTEPHCPEIRGGSELEDYKRWIQSGGGHQRTSKTAYLWYGQTTRLLSDGWQLWDILFEEKSGHYHYFRRLVRDQEPAADPRNRPLSR